MIRFALWCLFLVPLFVLGSGLWLLFRVMRQERLCAYGDLLQWLWQGHFLDHPEG